MFVLFTLTTVLLHKHISVCTALRLVNGTNQLEGTVQVLYNGTWGSVCDNNWDILDAHVVCHQLGYVDAIAATRQSHFGISSGIIIMLNMYRLYTEVKVSMRFINRVTKLRG